jgi:hypothetical protein
MKQRCLRWAGLVALAALFTGRASALDPDMARFAAAKEAQARQQAEPLTNKVPPLVWSFFAAVRADDWDTATNLAGRLNRASGRYAVSDTNTLSPALMTAIWPPISETLGAYEQFHDWDNKWLRRFGSEIIGSIPKGSIYFGGTDPGRFVITALSESPLEGRPFFTLTQNQLADSTYLEYLRKIYGRKLNIPTPEDAQKAFSDYMTDVQERIKTGGLRPGENARVVDGRMQISGEVAVMAVNGLIAKVVLDGNPDRQFYIEESFPLEWMYPQLLPHGLIFELQHKPLPGLSAEVIRKDHDYWQQLTGELVGGWLTDKTSVTEVCDFADKIYVQKNLEGFKGDAGFAGNADAQKTFSKLRSAIAGLYVWRMDHTRDPDEKDRLRKAADAAYQQAFVFCPYSPEAVFRYVQFLTGFHRQDDAILIAGTALRATADDSPYHAQFRELARQLHARE